MSNSERRAAVHVCVCLPASAHFLVFAHHLNQYTQEGDIKAAKQLQAAEAGSGPHAPSFLSTPQSFQSVQQTTLSTFVSLALFFPPGHDSSFLSAYWRPSICSFSLLPFFHHSSHFFSSNESFQIWPSCTWREPLRVTKTANQSQSNLSGLGYVSLIRNDRRKPEMDFRVAGPNSSHVLTCSNIRPEEGFVLKANVFTFSKTLRVAFLLGRIVFALNSNGI